jgi:pimeloyl-ACP methyl ester carboxylesterase
MGDITEKKALVEEHTFDTGVVSINYAEGPPSGQPLVLLHGGAGSWRSFLKVIPKLIPKWHVYAPDFRGHGRSGRVPGGYRWTHYVQDTVAFLHDQVSEPAILWGGSLGGAIAAGAAAQASRTVRALVLEDAWLDLHISEEVRQFLRYRQVLVASVESLDEMMVALKNEPVTLPGHDEPRRRGAVEDDVEIRSEAETLMQLDPEVYRFGWEGRLAEGYDMDAILEQVVCPTLLLQANPELGGLVDDKLAAHAMTLLSQVKLVSIPKARHSILQSQPKVAMRAVNEFLESLSETA